MHSRKEEKDSTTTDSSTTSSSSTSLSTTAIQEVIEVTPPKKLQHALFTLLNKNDEKDTAKKDPFSAEKTNLLDLRISRQLQSVAQAQQISVRVNQCLQGMVEHKIIFDPTQASNPITAALAMNTLRTHFTFDTNNWTLLVKEVIADFKILRDTHSDGITARIFILWQAIYTVEINHFERYEKHINVLTQLSKQPGLKENLNRMLAMLKDIYKLKKDLELVDNIGLYGYRLEQYMLRKNRPILFEDGWQIKGAYYTKINGFADACVEYRKQFEKILLLHTIKQKNTFETIQALGEALRVEDLSTLSPAITKDIPDKILNTILACLTQAVTSITTPVASADSILSFILLVQNEQILKDIMRLIQSTIRLINLQTSSTESILEILPTQFSENLLISHEEQIAQDKQRLKEIEKDRRAKNSLSEEKKREQKFTEVLKNQNEQKKIEERQTKKDSLLKKVRTLSTHQLKLMRDFLNPDNAEQLFDEETICDLLIKIDLLEQTTLGFKVKNHYAIASTHRSHDGMLNISFCKDIRTIFADLGITANDLTTQPSDTKRLNSQHSGK